MPLAALVLVLLLASSNAGADGMTRREITLLGGVQFGGTASLAGGDASFESGPTFGGSFGYRVRRNALITLGYQYRWDRVNALVVRWGRVWNPTFEAHSGLIQLGGEVELEDSRPFTPFVSMSIGARHFSPRVNRARTKWYLMTFLAGGLKIQMTRNWGIRTQVGMVNTYITGSSSWYCSTEDSGSCLVTGDLDVVIQGEVNAGIYYQF
jgi:hypothetical protein